MEFEKPNLSTKQPRNLHSVVREENVANAARARAYAARPGADEDQAPVPDQRNKENHGSWISGIFTGYIGCFYSPASLSLLQRPQRPVTPPQSRRVTRASMLQLKRIDIPPEYFLDRVHRDFISGRIVLEAVDPYYDFDFVDLRGREKVDGTPEHLTADEFLFRAIPLALRTWQFQSQFESENSVESLVQLWHAGQKSIKSIDDIRIDTLQKHLLDNWLWLSYSPALASICAAIVGAFTSDTLCCVILIASLIFCVQAAKACNLASRLHYERWITLAPRLGVIVWILAQGLTPPTIRGKPAYSSSIPSILRIVAASILAIDVIIGDILSRVRTRLHGTRYIFRANLSRKFMICERVSNPPVAALSEAILGQDMFAEQADGHRFALIGELEGILCELRPLTVKDLPRPVETTRALKMYSVALLSQNLRCMYSIFLATCEKILPIQLLCL